MTNFQSPYNDAAFNITSVPAWKHPPVAEDGPARRPLSPRAKAGIGAAAVTLAAVGMFSWSQYEQAQVAASIQRQQLAVQQGQLDLARQQQAAAQAKTAGQETPAQKARRLAVEACVVKAGDSNSSIADCGQIYPVTGSPALADTSSSSDSNSSGSSNSAVGLFALAAISGALGVGYVKKRITARSSS